MDLKDIITDSIQYPLSDLKKFIIFAFVLFITQIWAFASSFDALPVLIWVLVLTGFFVGFLVNGYFFRIIEYALDGRVGLPDFEGWKVMFIDGGKVFLIEVVYMLPAILITIFLLLSTAGYLAEVGLELDALLMGLTQSKILETIVNMLLTLTIPPITPEYPYILLGALYLVLITPIFMVGVGLMANYDGELSAAFRFRELWDDIAGMGWVNLIIWYLVTGLIFLALTLLVVNVLFYLLSAAHLDSRIFYTLTNFFFLFILTYSYLFFARSLALVYISGQKSL